MSGNEKVKQRIGSRRGGMKLSFGRLFRFSLGLCRRPWVIALESLAVVAGLSILAVGALLWRLSLGPIDLGFARPWLEEALRESGQDFDIEAGKLVLEWEGAGKPLLLGLEDMRIVRPDRRVVLSVEQAGVSLSLSRLALGRVEPRTVILNGPALRIVREEDNTLTLGMAQKEPPAPPAPEDETQKDTPAPDRTQQAADIGQWLWTLTAHDPAAREKLPAFIRSLRRVEIRDARLMIEDHVNGVSWYLPQTDFTLARRDTDLSARIGILLPGDSTPSTLSLEARQATSGESLDFDLSLSGFDPRLIADRFGPLAFLSRQSLRVDIQGFASLSRNMRVREASAVISAGASSLYLPQAYSKPLALDSLKIELSYAPETRTVEIPSATISLAGVAFDLSAKADLAAQSLTAHLRTGEVTTEQIQAVWPDAIPEDNSTEWIHHRISKGKFSDLDASVALHRDTQSGEPVIEQCVATFAFDGVGVDYRPPLYPVTAAKGTGRFDVVKNELVFKGEKATIRDMSARKISAVFDEILTAGKGTADLDFDLSGPLPTALSYLALEPIRMGGKLPVDPKTARGDADLHVHIGFPTVRELPAEQVKVKVKGSVANAILPKIVAGLDIEGGPLNVETFEGYFTVGGKGQLSGRPVDMDWTQYLSLSGAPYAARARAKISADKGLRDYFHIALDDYLSGTVPVDLTYTENKDDTASVKVAVDLTPARVTVRPFLYDKQPGAAASATLDLTLRRGKPEKVENLAVQAPELALSGGTLNFESGANGESELRRGEFSAFRIGQTDARFSFESAGQGKTLSLALEGPSFDARPFLDDSYAKGKNPLPPRDETAEQSDARPLAVSLRTSRMRTTGEESVSGARAALGLDANGVLTRLDFSAQAGTGGVNVRYAPDSAGRWALRCEAADAGATLRAFGVYEKIRGGTLHVLGAPMGNRADGDISGTVQIENFKVVKAPVLAQLVSAMSIPGLLQSLSTDGLEFSRAQAAFDWLRTDGHSAYQFRDGRTSGNSLGLTFMGTVDKKSGQVDISGTVAPMSEINSLIGSIPLIGDILAGGKDGAIIAAIYAVKGSSDNPRVLINPLAALTPGILRRLLFEDSEPKAPQAPSPSTTPRRERSGVNR